MSGIEIQRADPLDEALLRRIWEIGSAIAGETPWVHDHPIWPVALRTWTVPESASEARLWVASLDGTPVGYADSSLPLADNTHLVEVFIGVDSAHRRGGVGSALLAAVTEDARAAGRTLLMTGLTAGFDGIGPGQAFATTRGFELAQVDIEKAVPVDDHVDSWRQLLVEVDAISSEYRLVDWIGACPSEHVTALCRLASGFNGEIPLGELDLEDEHWDAPRLREHEARNVASGSHEIIALAYAPDGSPAAYTIVRTQDDPAEYAFQEATLVVPAHRGHRLGLRLKLHNQLALVEHFPHVRTIETGNAHDNDHMNAVNERLGFRPVARWLEMQRRL